MDIRIRNPPPYLVGVSLVLLACHAVSLHASQSAQQFAARADAVRLDVSVLGRDKQPVRGLTAADFTILEEGKPRPITTFAEVSLPDREVVSTTWMRDIAPDVTRNDDTSDHRLMVLVLDDALIPQTLPAFVNSTKAIGRGLIEQMGPRDLVAVVYTRDNRKTQSFTKDRARLQAAVDAFNGGPHDPLGLMNPDTYMAEKSRGLETLRTLNSVVEALENVPDRRKSIVFVSLGVPVDPLEIPPPTETPLGALGDPAFQIVSDMKELLRCAERANVSVFAVDPGGLDGLRPIFERYMGQFRFEIERRATEEKTRRFTRLYRDFLTTMANYSGGRAFVNTNEFETGVSQIFRETGHYYLIGFEPANAKADGRFRRVEARVGRSDATVRSRRGYFAERPARDLLPPPSTVTALEGLLPKSDLPLVAAAAPFAGGPGGQSTVAITLGLPAPAIGGAADKVAVLLNAYDVNGAERATQKFTATVALPATVQGSTFEVVSSLDLPPGRYELRLSADSATRGKAGSVYTDVDVPDFHKTPLTLSGVVVGVVPASPRAVVPGVAAVLPVVPTVQRSFSAAETVTAFLRIYQGGDASAMPVVLTTRIIDSANATAFELPKTIGSDEFGGARSYDHTFTVPIGQLKPGEHVLIFEARSGRELVRRDIRFIVR